MRSKRKRQQIYHRLIDILDNLKKEKDTWFTKQPIYYEK